MRDMATGSGSAGHLGGGLSLDEKATARVAELVERLQEYRDAYDNNQPKVSDAAYDALEDELRAYINRVGRTKLLKPVIQAMCENADLRPLAEELVRSNDARWHGSTRTALAFAGAT